MGVSGDDGGESCGFGVEVEGREIVKNIQVEIFDVDDFCRRQRSSPLSGIDVATNRRPSARSRADVRARARRRRRQA
jgi:hypothetical protein